MIISLKELIERIIKKGGSMDDFIFITNVNNTSCDIIPIDFEIIDDEIHIMVDC